MRSKHAVIGLGLWLLLVHTCYLSAETILASDFNATYSCQNPFIANDTTTIILNEDISIEGVCELIEPGDGFDSKNDRIIVTASTGNRVVIRQSSTWKIGLTIQFTGNAHLEKEPGAIIYLLNKTNLIMSENSRYITIPVGL